MENLNQGFGNPEPKRADTTPNRSVLNSVFVDLFSIPAYRLEAYRALHPEDTDARVEDIQLVTLKLVMTNHIYNDLGFTFRNKWVYLVEAQSSWSPNIAVRQMMYLADTFQEHIYKPLQNMYGTRPISLPEPELYVLYSGEEKVADELSLAQVHWGHENAFVSVKVKVLKGGGQDIFSQYIDFGKVYHRNMKEMGRTQEMIKATIQECKEKGILRDYLTEREAEVMNIMSLLYDQDVVTKHWLASERREAREEGWEEGEIAGEARGRAEGRADAFEEAIAKLMKAQNLTREEAEKILL